jgi:DNA-binding HxlR family transcriptional regulator
MYPLDMAAQPSPAPVALPAVDEDSLEALQAAVGVLAAKWSVVVLARLATGSRRFNELLRQIDGVSRRMLSATLRQLERDGLVERHVYARVPARVGYELSPAGAELLAALAPLAGWGVEHRAEVFAAREQYDRLLEWRSNREGMQARSRAGAPPASLH